MLHRLALAAALALPVSIPVSPASADSILKPCAQITLCADDGDTLFGGRDSTEIDLGIEVARVPLDRSSVLSFVSRLTQRDQYVLVVTCSHYVDQPNAVRSRNTLSFCRVLLG